MTEITIRDADPADLAAVRAIHEAAFGGEAEAQLTADLLTDPSAAPRLSLLALQENEPVGHILFTKVEIDGSETDHPAAILCPMAVLPDRQSEGVGSGLVTSGLHRLMEHGTHLIFVLGYPAYYTKFGFAPAGVHGLGPPYPIAAENADAWMVRALRPGILDKEGPGAVRGRVTCADSLARPEYWRE